MSEVTAGEVAERLRFVANNISMAQIQVSATAHGNINTLLEQAAALIETQRRILSDYLRWMDDVSAACSEAGVKTRGFPVNDVSAAIRKLLAQRTECLAALAPFAEAHFQFATDNVASIPSYEDYERASTLFSKLKGEGK